MKQRLTRPGSTGFSVLLSCSLHSVLVILSLIIVPVTQSKTTSRANNLDLNLEHHRVILDELKTKVLQTMGRSIVPRVHNASHRMSHNQKIREMLRRKFNTTSQEDGLHKDIYLNDLQTHVFQSSDPVLVVPVQRANTPTSAPVLTIIKFSTNFQQPDVPYHDLLIKSAILRLRIIRQKRKLRRKANLPLNLTIYLIEKSEHSGDSEDSVKYTPLRSLTFKTLKPKIIKVNIESKLLSHLVDSGNKTVTIGVWVDQTFPVIKKDRKVKQVSKRPSNRTTSADSHQKNELIVVSKIILKMTSQTRDLRKARPKRQDDDNPTCENNLCCRHSVYVDFADIGWEWVLDPPGYTAYYCKGGCEDGYKYANSFTLIKNIMHDRKPDIIPAAVCAPIGYNNLTIMIDDGQYKTVDYPGLVVTGCRCH